MTVIPALQGASIPIPGTTWALAAGPDAIPVALGMRHSSIAVDVETFGLGALAWDLKAVCISDGHTAAVLDPRDSQQHAAIVRVLADAPELILHNSVFDVPVLYNNKLMDYASIDKVTDTLLHARLANPDTFTPKSLEAVGDRLKVHAKGVGIKQTFKQLGISTADGFFKLDLNAVSYLYGAALDGLVTYHIASLVKDDARTVLKKNPFSSFRVHGSELEALLEREQIVNRVLLRRACKGIRVDFEFAENYRKVNAAELNHANGQLTELGIKPGDGNSLLKWMDGMGLIGPDHPKTPTGKLQATAAVLEELSHPIATEFVRSKRLTKVQKDYLDGLAELSKPTGGRIHPRTNILAAVTGRDSVSSPALQQLPPAARGLLLADEGDSWTSLDWKQIEPVAIANIAGDMGVLRQYENPDGGGDLYEGIAEFSTQRGAPMSRKTAKVVVLGLVYGMGLAKLSKSLDLDPGALIETDRGWTHEYAEARAIRDQVFEVMPATEKLIKNVQGAAKNHRCVPTMSGRVIPIPVYRNKITGAEEIGAAKAANYITQGSCADLLHETIAAAHAAGLADAIQFAVHDEIVCHTDAAADIEKIMQTPPASFIRIAERVPVLRTDRFDMGERWRVEA